MKKIFITGLSVILLAGCAHKLEEADFAEETFSETAAETSVVLQEATEPVIQTGSTVTEAETTPETEYVPTAEDFLLMFENADLSTGKLGSNMKEVLKLVHDDIHVKKLTAHNIAAAFTGGCAESTLFAFSVSESSGILPITAGDEEFYAMSFRTGDEENFTALFGKRSLTEPADAMRYVNTCGRADYLAFCSKSGNDYFLIPIAAGTSRDGIYAVLPNLSIMGYDVSAVENFSGITQDYSIYITDYAYDEETSMLAIEYKTSNTFSSEIYFQCEEIFIGGEVIPEDYINDFPQILYDKGVIVLRAPEYEGEGVPVYYFRGAIYSAETDDELCEAGIAAYNMKSQSTT